MDIDSPFIGKELESLVALRDQAFNAMEVHRNNYHRYCGMIEILNNLRKLVEEDMAKKLEEKKLEVAK